MSTDDVIGDDGFETERERVLTQLTEYTDDALWIFTADWSELVFINSAYEDIFGQRVEALEANPRSFLESVHPEDRPTVTEAMGDISAGEATELEFRVDPGADYGTWVWVQAQPTFDDSGDVEYAVGYTRDITERKQYERKLEEYKTELERSNENLQEFAYIASHDLQEPLRMVSSYVGLLESEYGDELDEEAEEYMAFAVDGAKRMKEMINSLLAYSRVDQNAGKRERIDAGDVFENTRQDLEMLIEDHDADVSAGSLPTVRADPDQLGQVFQNLVKNALEHADGAGRTVVEVTATEREDGHEFAVSDNGPGIPADQRAAVFKIFHKGSGSSDAANTGIGLAITERIVQRHGGEIWIDSDDGAGTTFRFTLPGGDRETERGAAVR